MTRPNLKERITLTQILKHPWLHQESQVPKQEFHKEMQRRAKIVSEYYLKMAEDKIFRMEKMHHSNIQEQEFGGISNQLQDFISSLKPYLINLRSVLKLNCSESTSSTSSFENRRKIQQKKIKKKKKQNKQKESEIKPKMSKKREQTAPKLSRTSSLRSDCSYNYSSDLD